MKNLIPILIIISIVSCNSPDTIGPEKMSSYANTVVTNDSSNKKIIKEAVVANDSFQFAGSGENIVKAKKPVNSVVRKPLNQLFVAWKEISYEDLSGTEKGDVGEEEVEEIDTKLQNKKFYKVSYLKVDGDKVFLDHVSASVSGKDTTYLPNDGMMMYFKGSMAGSAANLQFNLKEVIVNHFERQIEIGKGASTFNASQVLTGRITSTGIEIDNVLYKPKYNTIRMISENPALFGKTKHSLVLTF